MSSRDTRTGRVQENMIYSALDSGDYSYEKQVIIGEKLGGRKHKVDALVTMSKNLQILVSSKWQQVSGTAEEKVPFDIMCLAEAIHNSDGSFNKAYVVLGGEGWTLREYYLGGKIRKYLKNCDQVEIISLESFIAKANRGKL
jgi:hypothetical protein